MSSEVLFIKTKKILELPTTSLLRAYGGNTLFFLLDLILKPLTKLLIALTVL